VGQIPDAWSNRYNLNRLDLADNIKRHSDSLPDT
jgi:hypothetical protein